MIENLKVLIRKFSKKEICLNELKMEIQKLDLNIEYLFSQIFDNRNIFLVQNIFLITHLSGNQLNWKEHFYRLMEEKWHGEHEAILSFIRDNQLNDALPLIVYIIENRNNILDFYLEESRYEFVNKCMFLFYKLQTKESLRLISTYSRHKDIKIRHYANQQLNRDL